MFMIHRQNQDATLLDNYWARSKVFRVVQFSSALLSGLSEKRRPALAEKLLKVSAAVSNMRVMLRLLDDIPAVSHVLTKWNSSQDDALMGKLPEIASALCNILYYPVEHVAWAADQQLLRIRDTTSLWTLTVILWAVPLLISLIQTLKQLVSLRAQLYHIRRSSSSSQASVHKLTSQQFRLSLDVTETLCDLGLAVFWMPSGFLWAGKLPTVWWGLLGTISSLIGLHKIKCQL